MGKRIPREAFDYHMAGHSYSEVAKHYGVTKRAVAAYAKRHSWALRRADIELEARRRADQKIIEDLETMELRHIRSLKAIQVKALEALRSKSLDTAMEAVRALDIAIKHERIIRGEPADRLSVETGVLVVPAPMTAQEWIEQQEAKNRERECPVPWAER